MFEPMKSHEITGDMVAYLMSKGHSFDELEPKGFWEKYTPFIYSGRISSMYLDQIVDDFYRGKG